MSAVNNTLREIILRERPLTVTNNGSSLSLSLSLSFSLPSFRSALFRPRLLPLLLPLVYVACTPDPFAAPFTPRLLRSVYIPHAFFRDPPLCTHSRRVNAAGQFQHSNQWTSAREEESGCCHTYYASFKWIRLSMERCIARNVSFHFLPFSIRCRQRTSRRPHQ